jgi:hypothetical protein
VADKGFARTQHVQELLWAILATHGPEAGTDTSCHDDTIGMSIHGLVLVFIIKQRYKKKFIFPIRHLALVSLLGTHPLFFGIFCAKKG